MIRHDEDMALGTSMNIGLHPTFGNARLFVTVCDNLLIGPDGKIETSTTRRARYSSCLSMEYDIIIIGAGIAGLVTANRAAQLGLRVVVLEKSTEEKYICNSRYAYGTFHINFTGLDMPEDALCAKIDAATDGFARKDWRAPWQRTAAG